MIAPLIALAVAAADPNDRRADEIARFFDPHPAGYAQIFAPSFLAAVPPAKLDPIFQGCYQQGGHVVATRRTGDGAHGTVRYEYRFERGLVAEARLGTEPGGEHRVTTFWLGGLQPPATDLPGFAKQLATLHGQVSFQAAGLDGKPLAAYQPDRAMALGSAFKLFILGGLVEEIAANKRRWSDVVRLDPAQKSLPSGMLQTWPDGAPVTLHTLATLMISISDNTATDHLLHLLGRQRVEGMMAKMGVAAPQRSWPFMATHEMFALKWGPAAKDRARYLGLDVAGRRAFLAGLPPTPSDLDLDEQRPVDIDRLEWFASGADVCRSLAWLQAHATGPEAGQALGVLAVNPGTSFDPKVWPYVGYKGGSEPGVLSMNYLLRRADGRWFTLAFAWNDPQAPVELDRGVQQIRRAVDLLAHLP